MSSRVAPEPEAEEIEGVGGCRCPQFLDEARKLTIASVKSHCHQVLACEATARVHAVALKSSLVHADRMGLKASSDAVRPVADDLDRQIECAPQTIWVDAAGPGGKAH